MPEVTTASMTPKPVPIPSATDEAMSLDDATMTSVFWLIATVALVLLAAGLTVAPGTTVAPTPSLSPATDSPIDSDATAGE
jgi:hypothetical protein